MIGLLTSPFTKFIRRNTTTKACTNYSPPPTHTMNSNVHGDYCMKGVSELIDNENSKTKYKIHGYSKFTEIADEVHEVCNIHADTMNIEDNKQFVCDRNRLVFIGPRDNCKGLFLMDENDNLVRKIF